jgi:hypothetical protein
VTDRLAAGLDAARAPLAVLVDDRLDPPLWPWLHHLTDRLDADPSAVATTALLVEADQTVVAAGAVVTGGAPAPFLRGATPDDVVRAAALPLPAAWPGVVAVRTPAARAVGGLGAGPTDLTVRLAAARAGGQRHGSTYVVPDARVVVPPEAAPELLAPPPVPVAPPPPHPDLLATAGYRAPGEPLRVREGVPALRWALDIAAPVAPRGRRWGDDPFARSLGAALERLGQWVTIDHPETRGRASRADDDVVLVLRGLDAVPVREDGPVHALWVISHPDEVTAAEVAGHDVVLAASPTWAAERSRAWGRPVEPLLQCTDAARFHPGLAEPDTGPAVLFVGNSRNAARPAVDLALAAGLPLTVYGDGWSGVLPPEVLAGISVPNDRLGALYAAAGVVLGDHWADMRARGFVSNRVFDVLACGGRLLSDDVAGLSDLFGDAVAVWRTPEEFADLVAGDPRRAFPGVEERAALAGKVVREHSFDARARHLVDALVPRALARRDRP